MTNSDDVEKRVQAYLAEPKLSIDSCLGAGTEDNVYLCNVATTNPDIIAAARARNIGPENNSGIEPPTVVSVVSTIGVTHI